ncbi:DUF2785 domain-containing protein [Hamadaea tsunoensis]|uniref:DUF2785 domain-containing protein n=1 Tax=Hamadaea tsunoensis TaxID=53368 RepID=UPI000429C91A|nr:DUF2785 domain-containing protein [Hamadaea tsunoensis]
MFDAAFWEKIKADDLRVPAGYQPDLLIEELEHLLRSPEEAVRDKLAFEILADWVLSGVVDHDLADFGDRLCAALFRGLGESESDSVFGRSFAAATLGMVIERDNAARLVDAETIQRWLGAYLMWWELEADLRGAVDPRRGVAHALAHGADVIAAAARSRHLPTDQARVFLGSIVVRIRTGELPWLLSEDDRLAYATMALLHRGDLGPADLADVLAPLRHLGGAENRVDIDPGAYARINALNWLRALYLQLHLGVTPMPWYCEDGHFERSIPARDRMLEILGETLRFYSYWYAE